MRSWFDAEPQRILDAAALVADLLLLEPRPDEDHHVVARLAETLAEIERRLHRRDARGARGDDALEEGCAAAERIGDLDDVVHRDRRAVFLLGIHRGFGAHLEIEELAGDERRGLPADRLRQLHQRMLARQRADARLDAGHQVDVADQALQEGEVDRFDHHTAGTADGAQPVVAGPFREQDHRRVRQLLTGGPGDEVGGDIRGGVGDRRRLDLERVDGDQAEAGDHQGAVRVLGDAVDGALGAHHVEAEPGFARREMDLPVEDLDLRRLQLRGFDLEAVLQIVLHPRQRRVEHRRADDAVDELELDVGIEGDVVPIPLQHLQVLGRVAAQALAENDARVEDDGELAGGGAIVAVELIAVVAVLAVRRVIVDDAVAAARPRAIGAAGVGLLVVV